MAVSVEKLNSPDLLRQDYKKEAITSRVLAKLHKGELSKKKTITVKLKGAVNKKGLPKCCKVIATTGLTTYNENDEAYYGDGETLLAIDVEALDIQQKARQDAQKNLGLVQDKLHVETDIGQLLKKFLQDINGRDRGKLPSEQEEDEE